MGRVIDTVQSMSTPGVEYEIILGDDGVTYCSCPAWPKQKDCKHMRQWRSKLVSAKCHSSKDVYDLLEKLQARDLRRLAREVLGVQTTFFKAEVRDASGKVIEEEGPRYLRLVTIKDRCQQALAKFSQNQLDSAYAKLDVHLNGQPLEKEDEEVAAVSAQTPGTTLNSPGLLTEESPFSASQESEEVEEAKKKFIEAVIAKKEALKAAVQVQAAGAPMPQHLKVAANAIKIPSRAAVLEEADEAGQLSAEVVLKPEDIAKLNEYIPVENFDFMVDEAKQGGTICIYGPTGSGKSETAKQIAKVVKAEYFRQQFTRDTTVENVLGDKTIGLKNGVQVTEFEPEMFAQAVELAAAGNKVLYNADEPAFAPPEVLAIFHEVMEVDDSTRARKVAFNKKKYTIPGGMLTMVFTANQFRVDESGMYTGGQVMNAAFCNRFEGVYYVDYAKNEDKILLSKGIPQKIVDPLWEMAKAIRKKAIEEHNPVVCSTRELVKIGKKAMRWGTRKAIEIIYLSRLLEDERKLVDPIVKAQKWPSK